MNVRFLLSVVAVFVTDMLLNFVVHGTILEKHYLDLIPKGVFRTQADSEHYAGFMLLQSVLFAIGFTWI